ncbi:MAG: hypothetical protein M0P69_09435 [Bacteroidales bacterium]|nr:hypothetical protein [Bacteroidales bacterium]
MPVLKRVLTNISPNDIENTVRILQQFHANNIPFSLTNQGIRDSRALSEGYIAIPKFYISVEEKYAKRAIELIYLQNKCSYLDLENSCVSCGCNSEIECLSSHKLTITPECWNVKSGNIFYPQREAYKR